VCSKFAIVDGVLHYRHKKHRNQKEGKNWLFIEFLTVWFNKVF
jgi:hypothetical protein